MIGGTLMDISIVTDTKNHIISSLIDTILLKNVMSSHTFDLTDVDTVIL